MPKITKDYGPVEQVCLTCGGHLHRAAMLDNPGVKGEEAVIRRYCPVCYQARQEAAQPDE